MVGRQTPPECPKIGPGHVLIGGVALTLIISVIFFILYGGYDVLNIAAMSKGIMLGVAIFSMLGGILLTIIAVLSKRKHVKAVESTGTQCKYFEL